MFVVCCYILHHVRWLYVFGMQRMALLGHPDSWVFVILLAGVGEHHYVLIPYEHR